MGGFMGGGGALNQLLMEMDPPRLNEGWRDRLLRRLGVLRRPAIRPNVVTMGATNIVETLDAALLRAGRFDRQLTIDAPDAEGRKDIIEYYLSKVRHEDMPIDRMAGDTIGYTPVTIKYIVNEATVVAHFNGRDSISYADFTEAREAHEWGIKQPIRGMKLEEKRRIAYHEAGHAFAMAMLQRDLFRVSKVTIQRHGRALGFAAPKPIEERYTQTNDEVLSEIQVCLASRAAEELFLNTQLTGVTSDLSHATRLAHAYLGVYGMGGSFYSHLAGGMMMGSLPDKRRAEQLLDEQYTRVKTLLAVHAESVHAIAQALIQRGELLGDDIQRIIDEKERERQSQDASLREDTRRIAYHEAGHAVAQAILLRRQDIGRVSIVSTTEAQTFNELRPLIGQQTYSRQEVLAEIQVKLASRAAEELFLNLVLDNSATDIKRARELAKYVISYMNPSDALFVHEVEGASDDEPPVPQQLGDIHGGGEEAASKGPRARRSAAGSDTRVRLEVDQLLREQYEVVKALLQDCEVEVHRLARALAEKGELSSADVQRILNGKLTPGIIASDQPPVGSGDSNGMSQADDNSVNHRDPQADIMSPIVHPGVPREGYPA
jgi:ATP-dependent Zn protease